MSFRPSLRAINQLREVKFTRHYTKYAAGSVLVEFGATKVLCTATIEEKVPAFLKGKGQGWLTAEYAMLPSATHSRNKRDSSVGKLSARSQEIQRLIGRSLRSILDFELLGERQILIDCDVIQADGGTRTASITGAYLALCDAVNTLTTANVIKHSPIREALAAISVGMYQGQAVLDLDYAEDSNCDTDMNVVMTASGRIVEIQGTAEKEPFSRAALNNLLDLAHGGIEHLLTLQISALQDQPL